MPAPKPRTPTNRRVKPTSKASDPPARIQPVAPARPRIIGRPVAGLRRGSPGASAKESSTTLRSDPIADSDAESKSQLRRSFQLRKDARRLLALACLVLSRGPSGARRSEVFEIDEYRATGERKPRKSDEPTGAQARMWQRDRERLAQVGIVVEEHPAREGYYRVAPSSKLTNHISLDDEELLLLDRLQAEVVPAVDEELAHMLASALIRLKCGQTGMGIGDAELRAAVKRELTGRRVERSRFTALQRAHRIGHAVKFQYRGRDEAKWRERTVEPYALIRRGVSSYLVGRDRGVKQGDPIRNFRLSRIKGSVEVLGESRATANASDRFQRPADFDVSNYFSAELFSTRRSEAIPEVIIDFDAAVGFIVANQFKHRHMLVERKDGSVRLHLRNAAPGELWEFLAEFSGHFRVVGGPEAKDQIRARLEETLALYRKARRKGRS